MPRLHFLRMGLGGLMLVLLAALAPAAGASPGAVLTGSSAWTGEYYNNDSLAGSPSLVRDDPDINFFWNEGTSPAPGWVGTDHYSVRWTRYIYFDTTDNWTFTTVNDDGMRVWVDGVITMDAWYDQGPTTHIGGIYLNAGWHLVKVEYYNRTLGGTARVSWSRQGAFPNWKGEYFNNQWLSGSPVLTRNDANINFNWGYGSPDPIIPPDHFSVRWTSTLYANAGTYRFTVTADDGVRVWVDGILLLDKWFDQSATTYTADISIGAGNHTIKMEYYEDSYLAVAQLSYTLAPSSSGVWHGQYFNNMFLAGSPVLVRDDPTLNFNWGTGSPGGGVPVDNFSAKWDSVQTLGISGNYTISATSDDGVRVWIDGAIAIDAWYDHPATTFTSVRYLTAGAHNVHVEYYEHLVNAMIKVESTLNGPPPPPPPSVGDVIVDDQGPGWQAGGCASCWRGSGSGYGSHSFWTWNNTFSVPGYDWARWYPALPQAGNYEVFAYIPGGIANTTNARYWISHAGTYNLAARNQGLYWNQWVSLGTYYFSASGGENVSLTDVTYECFLCRTIVFDAVKFSPR
jgi:hypothetical protein